MSGLSNFFAQKRSDSEFGGEVSEPWAKACGYPRSDYGGAKPKLLSLRLNRTYAIGWAKYSATEGQRSSKDHLRLHEAQQYEEGTEYSVTLSSFG